MCYYQANYASLLRELKAALSPYGYLLTAAVHCGKNTIDYAYDFKALNEYAKLPMIKIIILKLRLYVNNFFFCLGPWINST